MFKISNLPTSIDTHFHLRAQENERGVIKSLLENNTWIILIGHDYDSSARALELAHEFPAGVYVAPGLHASSLHPQSSARNYELVEYDRFRDLARDPRVVALGDVGFDFEGTGAASHESQTELFYILCAIASESKLPLILSVRCDHAGMLERLKTVMTSPHGIGIRGLVHHFTGSKNEAHQYASMDFMLSLTDGLVHSHVRHEMITEVPASHLIVESLCPLFEPANMTAHAHLMQIEQTASRIAHIRGASPDDLQIESTHNALRLFSRMLRAV